MLLIWKLNRVTYWSRQTNAQIDSRTASKPWEDIQLYFCFTLPVVAQLSCLFVTSLNQWRGLLGANSSADWQASLFILYRCFVAFCKKGWAKILINTCGQSDFTRLTYWNGSCLVYANLTGGDLWGSDCKMGNKLNSIKNLCHNE